jgi:tRNA dimethylallyltransferase
MASQKIVGIVGPTATGKSDLAVEIALHFQGEVVSADSRQVYKGLDIGTGKITLAEMKGVPHHMLDVLHPYQKYSVAQFQEEALQSIKYIFSKKHLPILVGGTGFYIQAVVDSITLPEVPPDKELRNRLQGESAKSLSKILHSLDPERAKTIDKKNPVRLIRAIEIATYLGKVPPLQTRRTNTTQFETLQIGLDLPDNRLRHKIEVRLEERMQNGMIEEVEGLLRKGVKFDRLHELGLEYRYIALYLQGTLSKEEMTETLQTKIWQYARRQRTWFKRDTRIHWFHPSEIKQIFELVINHLK